jgi:hypothetical protein
MPALPDYLVAVTPAACLPEGKGLRLLIVDLYFDSVSIIQWNEMHRSCPAAIVAVAQQFRRSVSGQDQHQPTANGCYYQSFSQRAINPFLYV